jgi:hypothetical protein
LPNHSNDHNGAVGPDEADNAERPEDIEQRNLGAGHFSGDSQDSSSNKILSLPSDLALTIFFCSEGYTSISVREPLASIRAQTGQVTRRMDPHYASVSDDSGKLILFV